MFRYGVMHCGGLVEVNGKIYILGHRLTHGTQFSRQGTAEEARIPEDGTILQVGDAIAGFPADWTVWWERMHCISG